MRFLLLFSYLFCLVALAAAQGRVSAVNAGRSGIALKGYDAVSYFEEGVAKSGLPAFTHSWMNATWHFASAANRDRFAASPENFAPQFGGYCAYAVSEGYTAPIDPQAWKIVNGKLYLNYDKGIQRKWERDRQRRIDNAERNWPSLHR